MTEEELRQEEFRWFFFVHLRTQSCVTRWGGCRKVHLKVLQEGAGCRDLAAMS